MKGSAGRSSCSGITIVAALAFALVMLLIFAASQYRQNYQYGGYWMMGSGNGHGTGYGAGEGAGMMQAYWNGNDAYASFNSSLLGSLVSSESVPSASGNTLIYNGSDVRIAVLMGPMEEGQSMYSFVIDNMTNPTLEFRRGANVTFVVVNVDDDAYHSLTLTGDAPPYASYTMPMMMDSYGTTMMLAPESQGKYPGQSISFVAGQDMYYICTVSGHALKGMYGRILVG